MDIRAIALYRFDGEKFDGAIHPFIDPYWGTNVCTSITDEPFLLQDARLFLLHVQLQQSPLTPVLEESWWPPAVESGGGTSGDVDTAGVRRGSGGGRETGFIKIQEGGRWFACGG